MATSKNPQEGEPSFDERLEKLEGIVAELERGELGLEPAIARYQEGVELLKTCHTTLKSVRARVEELSKDAEGSLVAFDGDPDQS